MAADHEDHWQTADLVGNILSIKGLEAINCHRNAARSRQSSWSRPSRLRPNWITMRIQPLLALLANSAWSAAAAPATESAHRAAGLRLIKTAPEDPGKWVIEEGKITDYTAKGIGFVDITDITVCLMLFLEVPRLAANPYRMPKCSPHSRPLTPMGTPSKSLHKQQSSTLPASATRPKPTHCLQIYRPRTRKPG